MERDHTEGRMQTTHTSTTPPLVEPELGIWFDGRAYHYQHYRYDRLQDAIAYAKVDRGRPGFLEESLPHHWKEWHGPTSAEAAQMTAFGLTYEQGFYCYGPYRYEFLADALDYASRRSQLPATERDAGSLINKFG
jgi:hypothetical protein